LYRTSQPTILGIFILLNILGHTFVYNIHNMDTEQEINGDKMVVDAPLDPTIETLQISNEIGVQEQNAKSESVDVSEVDSTSTADIPGKGNEAAPAPTLNTPIQENEAVPTSPLATKEDEAVPTQPLDPPAKENEAVPTPSPNLSVKEDEAAPISSLGVPIKEDEAAPSAIPQVATEEEAAEEEHPEWEVDSSPIESSSDDSSDDSSSEGSDEEGDNAYKLLSPEEQARILMLGDGGSDDEDGGNKGAKGGGQLRTKNEVPEEVIPKPDVTITPEMPIQELGAVEAIVEGILLIKAKISGEYKVLESGSVLCLADRSVIGVVAETLGRVQQPLYSVRFTNVGEITEAGLELGTKVFYSEQHSTYVFTQSLKAFKGSDASNMHDEEVGDEEIEFSDDEAELEHKRKLKQRRVDKRGGKTQQNGGPSRGAHPLRQGKTASSLSYDDAEDDGPYKPLTRPSGFADTVGRSEAPQEAPYSGADRPNYPNRNGDQFRGRGRGDRGRGRGDRGRGRGGGFNDRRGDSSGHSLPPQGQQNGYYSHPGMAFTQPPMPTPQGGYPQLPQGQPGNFSNPSPNEYSPQQPLLWPPFPPQNPYQQNYQQAFQNMQNGWPNMPPPAPLPTGAFINPAFFQGSQPGPAPQWAQQGQQQQGHQQQQQPGNGGPAK
jgi:H/ACA ribonucleoprotein complex non-core subunit NAF1